MVRMLLAHSSSDASNMKIKRMDGLFAVFVISQKRFRVGLVGRTCVSVAVTIW